MTDWTRVKRTFIQVFGPVVIAGLYDFGMDGAIDLRSYVFGEAGFIVAGATALAVWMNRRPT